MTCSRTQSPQAGFSSLGVSPTALAVMAIGSPFSWVSPFLYKPQSAHLGASIPTPQGSYMGLKKVRQGKLTPLSQPIALSLRR